MFELKIKIYKDTPAFDKDEDEQIKYIVAQAIQKRLEGYDDIKLVGRM